jgi:hypothetical protein
MTLLNITTNTEGGLPTASEPSPLNHAITRANTGQPRADALKVRQ